MKSLREMTRAEIERESDKAHKACFALCDEMIAAGRGHERPSETATKDDELSRRQTAALHLAHDIAAECRRRMEFHGNLHRTELASAISKVRASAEQLGKTVDEWNNKFGTDES